jgi:DSF synthase
MSSALDEVTTAERELAPAPAVTTPHLDLRFEPDFGILWKAIGPRATPYFSPDLLRDIRTVQRAIRTHAPLAVEHYARDALRFVVFASRQPGVFSLGGDLGLFHALISRRDREGLTAYARAATDAVIDHALNPDGILSISLVQGAAMGGGFEAALAGNYLVAERGARLGFPEVLFGLFPGMGAYSLLRTRVSASLAERIILSGRNYASEELHEQGVVDILAEPGRGEHELRALVGGIANKPGIPAFRRAVRKYQAIDKQEIRAIADEWVSTALKLSDEHLRRIEKLRSAQSKLGLAPAPTPTIRYVAKAQAGRRAPRYPM